MGRSKVSDGERRADLTPGWAWVVNGTGRIEHLHQTDQED